MRTFLSVGVMLALCLISLEFTATADVTENVNPGSERQDSVVLNVAVVTTTTTAAAKELPDKVDDQVENLEKPEEKAQEKEHEAHLEHNVNPHVKEDKSAVLGGQQSEDDLKAAAAAAIVTTTTTAANAKPLPLQDASQPEAKITTTDEVTSADHTNTVNQGDQIHQGVKGAEVSHGDGKQNTRGQQSPEVGDVSTDLSDVKRPSSTEVKTATTTASVENPSGPKGDNGKEQSNGHAKKETPDREVKDAITRAQPTTHTVTKTGGESAQSTTSSGGATGGKKEQKASLVPARTTETSEKKDDHAAITPGTNSGEKEIIQEQKQTTTTTTTVEPTTPTVAPTTTLPKGFKLPQSLDKTDGSSSSTSLLIAFATFVTFIVITVAPVY